MPPVTPLSLLYLAVPAALSGMLNNAFKVIDQYAVQGLGTEAQAAIASTTFVLIIFFAGYAIISSGAITLISRAVGASDTPLQQQFIGNALIGSLLVGVLILSLSYHLAPWTTATLGLTGDAAVMAETYLRWHALFCLPQAIAPTLDAIFIAYGRTKTILLLQITASSLNFLLNPFFIYSCDLGIGGAALATGLSQTVSVFIGFGLLFRMIKPTFTHYRPTTALIRIVKIGLPLSWSTLLFAAVYTAIIKWVITPLGTPLNAALGIGFSVLEGFTWPVFWGFSVAIASIVGRAMGAGQLTFAQSAIHYAFFMLTAAGLIASAIFWFGAEPLAQIFTQDPVVLQHTLLYAHILAFSQLFVAYEALSEGVLSGAGATLTIFLWSAPFNLLRIPLCWLFAIHYGYGAAAIWWVINATTVVKAGGKTYAVWRGKWKTLTV
ncbi:MAG: MATE family efflux transporter [Methylococcaceae bacterium]|nr:MATE family efflux transporter [Methylococcaceae bacterium]